MSKQDDKSNNKHLDPNYKGEELPDELENGPIENRKCTDVLCCLIFIGFIIAWLVCGFYGFANGNPALLTYPYDCYGNQCGRPSTAGANYPYLYYPFPIPQMIDYRVCVKNCPVSTDNTTLCLSSSGPKNCTLQWSEFSNDTSYASTNKGIYNSVLYLNRFCLPNGDLILQKSSGNSSSFSLDSLLSEVNSKINFDLLTQWVSDVWKCWPVMFIVAGFTIFIAAFFLFLMRYFIGLMVWIAIILTFVAILLLAIFFQWSGNNQYSNDHSTREALKALSYILYVICALYILYIMCMYNRIRLAIAILKSGVSFVKDQPLSLLIPVVFFVVIIALYVYWTLAMIYLWSVGTYTQRTSDSNPIPNVQWTSTTRNALYYEFFGVLWMNAFLIALEQFILASTVSIWYFSANSDSGAQRPISRSIWRAFYYHLGSLAFGSFILAVIWTIKFILMYITAKVKAVDKNGKNRLLLWFLGCLMCYVNCFERFIKFLNKNAYIQVALHSTSFCTSAREAFFLILRNAGRFLALGSIGHVFQLLGKGIISISSTYFGYLIITHAAEWKDELHSPIFPTIVFLLISFLIAEIFMSVYGMACDVILYCFLVDEEICKRSGRGPIHAPELLKDFLDDERKKEDKKSDCCC
jgi:solute carrier family 44 (choline transporter-like protein), member 2/4/5